MFSECLKLFLILNFVANFTESKLEDAMECIRDSDCSPGFSCMLAKKYQKRICAKYKLTLCRICLFYSNTPKISQKMFCISFPLIPHSRPICTLISIFIRLTWYFFRVWNFKKYKVASTLFFSGSAPYFFCLKFAI